MNDLEVWVKGRIGKPFGPSFTKGELPKGLCWDFCREILAHTGKSLPSIVDAREKLTRVETPRSLDIVLFRMGLVFHGGIVWPDGLHFVHACPDEKKDAIMFKVKKERLTAFPWNTVLDGYYHVE